MPILNGARPDLVERLAAHHQHPEGFPAMDQSVYRMIARQYETARRWVAHVEAAGARGVPLTVEQVGAIEHARHEYGRMASVVVTGATGPAVSPDALVEALGALGETAAMFAWLGHAAQRRRAPAAMAPRPELFPLLHVSPEGRAAHEMVRQYAEHGRPAPSADTVRDAMAAAPRVMHLNDCRRIADPELLVVDPLCPGCAAIAKATGLSS